MLRAVPQYNTSKNKLAAYVELYVSSDLYTIIAMQPFGKKNLDRLKQNPINLSYFKKHILFSASTPGCHIWYKKVPPRPRTCQDRF